MSTIYRPIPDIRFSDLFDGALAPYQVRERINDDTRPDRRCLTDGNNYLWVSRGENGTVSDIERIGANAPIKILRAISDAFDVDIVSTNEPRYWGLETQEELDAWMEEMAAEDEARFYEQVIKYVRRGEAHGYGPTTVGARKVDIAKAIIAEDFDMARPENKHRLLEAIESVYERGNKWIVTLTPQDLAVAAMCATHEDDLPKA